MNKIFRSICAALLVLSISLSALVACGTNSGRPNDPSQQVPDKPLTLTYTVEDGKNVLSVSAQEDTNIREGFLNRQGNVTVGRAVHPSDIDVLRVGEGITSLDDTSDLTELKFVDIPNGESLVIDGYAFFDATSLESITIGGVVPTLRHEFIRVPQDQRVSVVYGEDITGNKTKYVFGGLPVFYESDAAIPDMSLEQYALATVGEARRLASRILSLYEGGMHDFLYMPYTNDMASYSEIKEFTLSLTEAAATDEEKVNAIYDYIVTEIAYDDEATDYAPSEVFKTKKAVCAGYVGLMHDMLSAIGIASFYTNGYTLGTPGVSIEGVIKNPDDIPEGHAVLAVVTSAGEVSFYDPTFGAADKEANWNISDSALGARMLISGVEGLTVMIDGVDHTLFTGEIMHFLGDDGYIYNVDFGKIFGDGSISGNVRNYWLSYRRMTAGASSNFYSDSTLQPAGTVFNGGMIFEGSNPIFCLPNGVFISAEKAFAYAELENTSYGKNITFSSDGVICENGVLYNDGTITVSVIGYFGGEEELVIPSTVQGKRVVGIQHSALHFSTNLRSLTISEGIEFIYSWSLDNCFNLEYLYLPSTFVPGTPNGPDETWPFVLESLTSLKSITVAEPNPHITTVDGVLYSEDMQTLMHYPAMRDGESFTVPQSVKHIADNAFAHAAISSVYLGDGVESVGKSAFSYSHLKNVTIYDGVEYDSSAFAYSRLESVTIEEGIDTIGAGWFSGCQSLREVDIPSTVKEIGASAFLLCTSLYRIELPDGVEIIGKNAFSSCARLVEISLPSGLLQIGDSAFSWCDLLYHVINNSTLDIRAGDSAYGGVAKNAALVSRGGADSLVDVYQNFVFYTAYETAILVGYLGNDVDLVLPESFEGGEYELAPGAFAGNTEWGWNTSAPDGFYNYSFKTSHPTINVRSITIPAFITYVPEHAFTGFASLETVYYYGERNALAVNRAKGGNLEFVKAELVYLERAE